MFHSVTMNALSSALDGLAARQQTIAQNIANVNTPNYRAKTVSFESALAQSVAAGSGIAGVTEGVSGAPTVQNGNNVSLDSETLNNERDGADVPVRDPGREHGLRRHLRRAEDRLMDAIGIAASALNMHQAWLNSISNNIANVNTRETRAGTPSRPSTSSRTRSPATRASPSTASSTAAPPGSSSTTPRTPSPTTTGYVRMPDIDLGEQMSS